MHLSFNAFITSNANSPSSTKDLPLYNSIPKEQIDILVNVMEFEISEIIKSKELGLHLEVHRANRTYDDSIILTLKELESKQYYFGLGNNRLYKILKKLIEERRVYYSSNEVGSIFKDYIKQYKLLKNNY